MDNTNHLLPTNKYIVLLLYALVNITNSAAWTNFAPIVQKLLKTYSSTTLFQVSWLSMTFFISYIPFNFLAVWLIEKKGIRCALLVGVGMQAVGACLRMLINYDFVYVIIGQTIMSFG